MNRGLRRQCIDDVPLSTRAWVLQEHVLAPRTLHFSSAQIFWVCRAQEACESFPRGSITLSWRGRTKRLDFDWAEIVNDYSTRNLTFGKDKFPGLAGLARKVQERTKKTYIAGLWLEELQDQRLWVARPWRYINEKPRKVSPLPGYALTWSWTSVDRAIDLLQVEMTCSIRRSTVVSAVRHTTVLEIIGLPSGKDTLWSSS
jgi:hypothetical protein